MKEKRESQSRQGLGAAMAARLASFASRSPRRLGLLEIAFSGFFFGFLGIFAKAALAAGVTAGENLALRFLVSAAFLWGVLLGSRRSCRLPWRQAGLCILLGTLGYAVFASCFFEALKGLSASLTVLLLYTYPVFVAFGSRFILGERLSRRTKVALPLVMLGLVALIWGDVAVNSRLAVAYGVASGAIYSAYIMVSSRWLRGTPPLTSVAYIQSAAGVALALFHLHHVDRLAWVLTTAWPELLKMALVSTVLPMVLLLDGLRRVPAADAAALSTVEPLTGVAAAALFLGERLAPLQLAGGVLVIGGLIYIAGINLRRRRAAALDLV